MKNPMVLAQTDSYKVSHMAAKPFPKLPPVKTMDLSKVRVEFQSTTPHKTLFLKVWVDANNLPQGMFDALARIGWHVDEVPPASPLPANVCYSAPYAQDDVTPIVEMYFHKGGTGLFCGWTPKEAKKNVPEIRNILRKFGFIRVGHRKLTLGDCL